MEKEILEVRLKGNCADTRDGVLRLGGAQSYGIYRLHITADEAWQGLAIAATFDCGGSPVTVFPAEDGLLDVPAEATASANTSCHPGSITFWGSNGDVRRVSARLLYRVYPTGSITGGNAIPPTPEVAEQLLARLDGKLDTPANTGAAGQVPVLQPDGSTLWGSVAGGTGTGGAVGKSAYQYAVEGGYTGTEEEFAAKLAEEIPDALPNPNALTFTGTLTASYDGSAPVSVNIPSGGGSGSAENWILVNTVTTAEDVSDIRITQDSDGNPLSLKKVKIFVKLRGNSANLSNWCRITVNNLANNFYSDIQNTFAATEGQDYYHRARVDFAIYAGRLMLDLTLRSLNNAASKNSLFFERNTGCYEIYPDVVDAITSIRMWSSSAGIGAGTELMIYGSDA